MNSFAEIAKIQCSSRCSKGSVPDGTLLLRRLCTFSKNKTWNPEGNTGVYKYLLHPWCNIVPQDCVNSGIS